MSSRSVRLVAAAALALGVSAGARAVPRRAPAAERVVVASKTFTESRVLAEMLALLVESRTGLEVERRMGLGGTLICFEALRTGAVDLYPEYTGTAWAVILKEPGRVADPLRTYLHVKRRSEDEHGLVWLDPFGLNNTYAMAMDPGRAAALGVARISDLVPHAGGLKAGLSLEFLNREDGWPGLSAAYGLGALEVRGMEHGLAYAAIDSGAIDLIDAYSTDGKLQKLGLTVLVDDRAYFPPYHAAPVVRAELLEHHPELRAVLNLLAFRISDERMQALNYRVEEEGLEFADAARAFLEEEGLLAGGGAAAPAAPAPSRGQRSLASVLRARWRETLDLTWQHVQLTAIAVLLAALVAIPVGVLATRVAGVRRFSLSAAGVIQTIPSLALLAFMIPLPGLGLGVRSAIAALFLYALLPILRNTYTGISGVDPELVEAARGIGLRERDVLMRVQLPLASRTILAGVRTSSVISVGVATLAAFIGAGGLGEPIVTGLQLNDTNLILSGAIPAALLAVAVDLGLGRLENRLVSRGLR